MAESCKTLCPGPNTGIMSFATAGLILGILFSLDIVSTHLILFMGGHELNPFMAGVVDNVWLHVSVKIAVIAVILLFMHWSEERMRGAGASILTSVVLWYAFVNMNNLAVLSRIL